MAVDRGMVKASMIATGFCINACVGTDEHGKARPLQDKATVSHKYFDLEDNLSAGQHVSVLSLANAYAVSWKFANKVVGEIQSGKLIDPGMKVQGRKHSDSALTLLDGGGFYLFHL